MYDEKGNIFILTWSGFMFHTNQRGTGRCLCRLISQVHLHYFPRDKVKYHPRETSLCWALRRVARYVIGNEISIIFMRKMSGWHLYMRNIWKTGPAS